MNRKYLSASIFYVIGNGIGQGVVLLSSAVFTRIMPQDTYGLVSTYATWVLVLNTFIGLNLFITTRNAYIDYRQEYEAYQSSVLLLSLLAFAAFTAVLALGIRLLGPELDLPVFLLACIQAISLHTINYQMAADAMENRYIRRTLLMILPNCTHTLLSILLVIWYSQNKYLGKILGNSLGLLLFAIVIIFYQFHRCRPAVRTEYWKYALAISLPGIMHTLSDLILIQSDRIMITELYSADETAVYSLTYNIASAIYAVYTAINGAWTSFYFKAVSEKDDKGIARTLDAYLIGMFLLAAGMLTVSPEILKLLSPPEYWAGIDYVHLIVIGSAMMYVRSLASAHLLYEKKTGVVARNAAVAAGLNVVLNFWLIPYYGGAGAAFTTAVSFVLLFILDFGAARKTVLLNGSHMGAFVVSVVAFSILFYGIRNHLILRGIALLAIMIAAVIYVLIYKKDMKR